MLAKAVVQAQDICQQYHRLRSLAKARQLPHLTELGQITKVLAEQQQSDSWWAIATGCFC
ncbi:hypothetical protein DYL59_27390 [Pseudomonas kairouanensis]|uniref:Uncharacterized protein n=1 Tax=Pseudomonas kairouanensis TaxID=2293832 RepID=A0A4Z0AF70_9PSED|nr:hypothetical protein DYL59_27390 [Pseudomonas kairouanensis]